MSAQADTLASASHYADVALSALRRGEPASAVSYIGIAQRELGMVIGAAGAVDTRDLDLVRAKVSVVEAEICEAVKRTRTLRPEPEHMKPE